MQIGNKLDKDDFVRVQNWALGSTFIPSQQLQHPEPSGSTAGVDLSA
jgi:hypothetical protein